MFCKLRNIMTASVVAVLLTSVNMAQSTFGSITGSVKDQTGAVVPGAEEEVINDGTGTTRRVNTMSSGVFNAPNLDLGTYRVRVTGKGFCTSERVDLPLPLN